MSVDTQNVNVFRFFHNAETKLYIEGKKEKENSIFSDIYKAFFVELKCKLPDIRRNASDTRECELRNNLNNIFAFVGERGTGKTSCMLSISKMLEENEKDGIVELNANKIKFSVLKSIDPSFFDEHTNILDIVLGRLFSEFREKWEMGNQDCIGEKNQLLESFEKVKQSISNINAKKYENGNYICEEDNVDKLINLGASVNLKEDIQELIQKYLKFINKNILVIPIDDIDLHSKCAYEMVEEIRKYLVQYNVIILMALKIEQLDKVVEKAYIDEFFKLINLKFLSCNQIANMANKYLIKLIPDSQRFVLPTIDVMYNKIVEIYEKTREVSEDVLDFLGQKWKKNREKSGYPARYIILKLIFDKTRYLFYHTQGATSFIVPHTLREFNQLLEMLLSMKNYKEIDSISEKQYNKSTFKNYFIQSWCRSNLKEEDCEFVKTLFSMNDPSIINKTVVQKLSERFGELNSKKIEEIKRITDENNKPYNISLGDVNQLLNFIKSVLIEDKEKALIFAVETFYSMRLYEYYDLKTEKCFQRENEKIENEVVVKSVLDGLKEYEILAGGAFFNLKSNENRVIPVNIEEDKRRDFRTISLNVIRTFLKKLLSKENLEEYEKKEFRLIELFALLISRKNYNSSDRDYRTRVDVVYASDFYINQDIVWFDVLSFFFNLQDVERCYNRIDQVFFDKAKGMDESLYNSLLKYCKENRPHTLDENHALLSYSSIRNMEIMNDFFNYMKLNVEKNRQTDNRKSLVQLFKHIEYCKTEKIEKGYFIKSYDEKNNEEKGSDKNWYQIDFNFICEFIKVLEDDEIEKTFNEIFNSRIKNTDEEKKASSDDIVNLASQLVTLAKDGYEKKSNIEKGAIDIAESLIEKSKEKSEKEVENKKDFPPSWDINEDLNNSFKENVVYSTTDVRKVIRDYLRSQMLFDDSISAWINRNVRNATGSWSNFEIKAIIEKFIGYIKKIQEKNK